MPLNIKIKYSDDITETNIQKLKRFEAKLIEDILSITGSTSNYRWEPEPKYSSDTYFRLVKICGNAVLGIYGSKWLSKAEPQELIDKLRFPDR